MKEQFCDYDISLKLKELGFDEPCLAYYTTGTDVTLDKDGNPTNFVLLSAKLRGELVSHGSVKNSLFKWLLEHDRTSGELYTLSHSITAPLWQQVIDWCDSRGLLVGTIVVDNLYKSTINKINYETELFHSRNESIKRAIEFAISYLQDNK